MKAHSDNCSHSPVIGWVEPEIQSSPTSFQDLHKEVRSAATRLLKTNADKIAKHHRRLTQAVRRGTWPAAAIACSGLYRLILIQIEAERILSRYRTNGGRG